jgi:hypothetical protein
MFDFDYVAIRTRNQATQVTTAEVVLSDPMGAYALVEYRPRVAPRRAGQLAGQSDVESVVDTLTVHVLGDSVSDATSNLQRLVGLFRQADDWRETLTVDPVEIAMRVRGSSVDVLSALIEGSVQGREPLSYDPEFDTHIAPGRWIIRNVELQFLRRGKLLNKDNPVDVTLTSLDSTDEVGSIFRVTGLDTYEVPAPVDIFVEPDDCDPIYVHTLVVTNEHPPIYVDVEDMTSVANTFNEATGHQTVGSGVTVGELEVTANDTPDTSRFAFSISQQPSLILPIFTAKLDDEDDVWDIEVNWFSWEVVASPVGRFNTSGESIFYGFTHPGDTRYQMRIMEPIPLRPFKSPDPDPKAQVNLTATRREGSGTTGVRFDYVFLVDLGQPGTRVLKANETPVAAEALHYYSREPYNKQLVVEAYRDFTTPMSEVTDFLGDSDITVQGDTLHVTLLAFGEIAQTSWRPSKASSSSVAGTIEVTARIYPAYLTPQ